MWDELLKSFGFNDYDELNTAEKETFRQMLETVERSQITVEDMKHYITTLRQGVDLELASEKHSKNQDLFLKARLKNYILFEAFLTKPEKARKMVEQLAKGTKIK